MLHKQQKSAGCQGTVANITFENTWGDNEAIFICGSRSRRIAKQVCFNSVTS